MPLTARSFASLEEEVRFLRGLLAAQRLADDILEDCLERQMGLAAAVDVFLSQCARMIHASGGFVELRGTQGPVLRRTSGSAAALELDRMGRREGAVVVDERHTAFVTRLELGSLNLGALGFVLEGRFEGQTEPVMALVDAFGEMLDSAVLAFLALAEGQSPLERLDELCDRAAFRPRSRIGKYELVTPLGTGGMAQVMVARTLGPSGVGRLVAIKRILPHLSGDAQMVEQFLDEARIGMRLSHPNLVTFYDFGQAAGGYFIAMELVRGVDFDRVIYAPPGRVEPPIAITVLVQALRGLHAAHELRGEDGQPLHLVHRDLSPHNLMVGFDGRVKVLDFGVAKARNQKTITLPGIVKGKPLYMSPEQAVADRIDRRSDLFSMGLILYEALVGARAFQRENDVRTMEAIVREELPRPARIEPPLWEVMQRALAKKPEHRFRTAHDMAEALAGVVPVLSDEQLGRFMRERFPARQREYEKWERLAAELDGPRG